MTAKLVGKQGVYINDTVYHVEIDGQRVTTQELLDRYNEALADHAVLYQQAAEVRKYWRDWPEGRRHGRRALSGFLANAIEKLSDIVERKGAEGE